MSADDDDSSHDNDDDDDTECNLKTQLQLQHPTWHVNVYVGWDAQRIMEYQNKDHLPMYVIPDWPDVESRILQVLNERGISPTQHIGVSLVKYPYDQRRWGVYIKKL